MSNSEQHCVPICNQLFLGNRSRRSEIKGIILEIWSPFTARQIRRARQSTAITMLIFGLFGTGLRAVLLFQSFAMDLVENFTFLIGVEFIIEA